MTLLEAAQLASYLFPVVIAVIQAIKARNYSKAMDVVVNAIETAPPEVSKSVKEAVKVASEFQGSGELVNTIVQRHVAKP